MRDCLPLPPTPISIALPAGFEMILAILEMWDMASSNKTRSIIALLSLYSTNLASKLWRAGLSHQSVYKPRPAPPP